MYDTLVLNSDNFEIYSKSDIDYGEVKDLLVVLGGFTFDKVRNTQSTVDGMRKVTFHSPTNGRKIIVRSL